MSIDTRCDLSPSFQCLALQAQLQYVVTLSVNENGYISGVLVTTSNSTCSLSNVPPVQAKTELSYQVTVRLQWNEAGPQ